MTKRHVAVDDILRLELVANPSLSPDGAQVLFEETHTDVEADGYTTQLMIADVEGNSVRALTSAGKRNRGAVWSPDGKSVAFLSDRAFGLQAWVLSMSGGEARRVTKFRYGISNLVWSPDGTTLYGLTEAPRDGEVAVFEDNVTEKEAREQSEKEDKDWADSPKRFDRLYYKLDGAGLTHHRYSQLVAVDVASGSFRQLTRGNYDVGSPTVSPDGRSVAFVSNRRENPDLEWWAADLYRVPAAGGDLELLSSEVSAGQLTYSPDGRQLAVLGNGDEQFTYWSAAHTHLFLIPSDGGPAVKLTADFPDTVDDRVLSDVHASSRAQSPIWSADGTAIYVLSTREGATEVVRFDVAGKESPQVVIGGSREVIGFASDGVTKFVICYATPTTPGMIATVDIAGVKPAARAFRDVKEHMTEVRTPFFPATEIRLDRTNAFLADVQLVDPEPFWYQSQDDWQVQGWVIKPPQAQAGKRYPVLLEIHGGPQLNYGYAMFHEMQWIAAQGYAVVFVNPRGGTSYGQEFVNGVRNHYGEGDAADVMNGLEAAISKFDFLDGTKVAVTGGSYGGFMTNWLVGHEDRFFAAVSQRSISNWFSFYGASDCGPLFVESQLGGDIFTNAEALWQMSPLKYAQNVKTPLLLIHSENDLRCPMEQSEQFYTAIKRNGSEVELLRVPNASHGLSRDGKPKLRLARLNAIFDYIHARLPRA
ncbi:S9 family peptidase [Alicyclobacillus sp. ALC3]|uniref:S9 family peptidase n=1 Tax=Alicyclobacillus sp. ALC3 TaxID=2796143 RepID=UPI002377FDE7|nr:S9 family peptidase [Alicyclobacillus sp. ALC3]WDL96154.1 S9 family peptidase [Alicyclobacillus sp. ALC3]